MTRILVVDDDAKFRSYVSQGLSESGLDCESAPDAQAADALLKREPQGSFDLILLDVMMPGKTGWGFLEHLRSGRDKTPVIFLTARHEIDERVKGLRLGADDYIIKPFEFRELLARIEAVVRRHRAVTTLERGELTIDLDRRVVRRGDQRIDMSPQEFDLLRALAEGSDRVLSRAELLHIVWGIDFDPGTNVVEVQVARLRRRIDRPGIPSLIQTVIGKGYQLAT